MSKIKALKTFLLTTAAFIAVQAVGVAQTNELAEAKRFIRVEQNPPSLQSFVIPLDSQKGIELDPMGDNAAKFPNGTPWFMQIAKETRHHITVTNSVPSYDFAFENPIAGFGAIGGGTPLYVGQVYNFGFYSGASAEGTPLETDNSEHPFHYDLYVSAYAKSSFNPSATNVAPVKGTRLRLPRKGTPEWDAFVGGGYRLSATDSEVGLEVTIRLVDSIIPETEAWGTQLKSPIILSVKANSPDYYFVIETLAFYPLDSTTWLPMTGVPGPPFTVQLNRLFTLDFEQRPPWRSTFIDQPQFEGEPVPPAYAGKTVEELLAVSNPVTKQFGTPPAAYSIIDETAELRRHPILDKFVADMGNDPIALANYVLNEIEITDGIGYNDEGSVTAASINAGGVNRGALATFLEGQGSPIEQSALLVYLLRQAGYPAVYVFPPADGMKMLDSRMSKLLQMQFRGLVNNLGEETIPHLVSVNYPWVATYVPDPDAPGQKKWVHIFPWLKDTEIKEGLNVYDYMPPGYRSGGQWLRRYLLGDVEILHLDSESDTVSTLFPAFVKKQLRNNHPNITIEDLGMKVRNRRNYFADWIDFPQPWSVSESSGSMVVRDNLDSISNIFDTVSVEVWSDRNNNGKWDSGEPRIRTADMRSLDLHNRRFLLSYKQNQTGKDQHTATLSLAPYRPGATGTGSFAASNIKWINKQVATATFGANDYTVRVKIVHKRQRSLSPSFDPGSRWDNPFGYFGSREVESTMSLSKGDLAAICLNFGRVSQRMVNVHAEEFWAEEKRLKDNPSATGDSDIFQGTTAYIMGMSYYEKVARYQKDLFELHKVSMVSSFANGLAKLGARRNSNGTLINTGKLDLVYPVVDMSFKWLSYAGNATFRPDQGAPIEGSMTDAIFLAIGDVSAQEHQAINTYFKQFDAVSTVRLLHLTQMASKPPLELNKDNYVASGEANYTYNGQTKKLKDWCGSSTWGQIVDGFTGAYADRFRVIMTPGPTTGANGTYHGVGAFVTYPQGGGAYITSNLNGGYGYPAPNNSFSSGNYANISLSIGQSYSPTINWSAPSISTPVITPPVYSSWNQSSNYNQILSGSSIPVVNQINAWTQSANYLSYVPSGSGYTATANLYSYTSNVGYAGQPSYYGGGLGSIVQFVADPVNSVTGEFYIDTVDIKLDGPMPLEIRRNYSSQNVADNEFGYGWRMNYFPYLVVGQGEDVIHAAEMDGSVIVYRKQSSTLWRPESADNPHLMNMNGESMGSLGNVLNAKIAKSTSGGNTYYDLTGADGSVRRFKVQSFPTGGTNGVSRQRPYLERWTDNKGNYYTFTFGNDNKKGDYGQVTRIAASNGNFLGFYYDTFGHIVEAYTGDGRRLYYRYDQYGDLVEATLPDATTVAYDYEHGTEAIDGKDEVYSKHLIVRETKPEGRIIENTYDSEARVTEQRATVGEDMTPVRNATFVYTQTVNSDETITGNTIVRDAYDREFRYDYVNSKITQITDPLSQSISYEWYSATDTSTGAYPCSIKKRTDKRGLITEYKYDARGNLIESKYTGDLTGSGANSTATTTYQYNSRNSLTEMVDPVGNKTTVLYENATYPYAPTTIEKYALNALVTKARMTYYNVTSGTLAAYGLLQQETQAFGSAEAATATYTHNANGFILSKTQQTGTADPDVVTNYRYNLRGELIEEKDALGRKIAYAYDGLGNRTAEERYNESGQLVAWNYDYFNGNGELEWSDGMRYNPEDYNWKKYDGAGRLIEEIQWRSTANANGTGVSAPPGDDLYATTFHRYDLFGNRIETRDARRNTTTMEYDQIGRMLTRKSYEGTASGTLLATEQWTYEAGDEVATYTNPLGGVTSSLYTKLGKISQRTESDGTVLNWRYYLDGRAQREPVNNNTYWDITYNDLARTITRALKTTAGATLKTEIKAFDRRGNCISETDGEGNLFTRTYDGLNRVRTETGPSGTGSSAAQSVTYSYDASGKVTTSTNALGEKNIVTKDILGRTVQAEVRNSANALIRQTTYAYAADHHSVAVTEGVGTGALTTTTYTDTFGKPVITIGGDGSKRVSIYDMGGNLLSSQDEQGQITALTYDALNRPTTSTNPDGSVVTLSYDAAGNLISRQMPGGLTWNALYDNANRIQNESLVGGSTTTRAFGYSYYTTGIAKGKLQKVTDPRGVDHTTTYDAYLRPETITASGGGAAGLTLTYTYDNRNLPTKLEQVYDAPTTGPPVSVHRSYDGYGQPTSEIVKINGQTHSDISLNWDGSGRRSTLSAAGANLPSPLFAYQYRADGKLTQVSANSQNYSFAYGNQGLLTSRSNPHRNQSIDQRDSIGRVTQQTTTVGGQTPLVENLGWRANTTLSSYSATRSGSGAWNESRAFTYNSRGQLLSEGFSPASGQNKTFNYVFDGGNAGLGIRTSAVVDSGAATNWKWNATQINSVARVTEDTTNSGKRSIPASGYALGAQSVEIDVNGIPVQNVSFPGWMDDEGKWTATLNLGMGSHTLTAKAHHPSGQYTSTKSNTFTVAGQDETVANGYDAAGNVISRTWLSGRTQSLTWDAEGRLIKVTERDSNGDGFDWSAVYDGLGRRLKTIEQKILSNVTAGSPKEIASTYDPLVEFLEIGVIAGGQQAWKVHGPDLNGEYGSLQGTGGLEAVIVESSGTTGFINDFLGNAIGSVTGGDVTWNATRVGGYGPLPGMEAQLLGNAEDTVASTVWKGKRLDPTGFYYLGARYYEPGSGRFLSPDPAGHASSMSLYDYANGDPINLYDPDGRVAIGFVKGLVMGSWSQPSNPAQAVGAVFGQLTSYFIPVVGQAAIVRDSTYSVYSAYNRIADIQQNGWSAGNAVGLGMDTLGALPVLGTATKVAGTATKAGSTFLRAEQSISGFGSAGIIRASESGSVLFPSSFGTSSIKSLPNPYAGIQEASAYLRAQGVSRADRVQILQSFNPQNMVVRQVGSAEFGIRFFSNPSRPGGSYLFETFPASRSSLAIKPEWSTMSGFKQFQVRPGATILEGTAAPQGVYLPGGQTQKFILDWRNNLLDL